MDKKIHKKISDSINTRMSEVLHDKINKMDKIDELKEKLLSGLTHSSIASEWFEKGFDAAMELQLPVLFVDYLNNSKWINSITTNKWVLWNESGNPDNKIADEFTTTKHLYDYWLQNIYNLNK